MNNNTSNDNSKSNDPSHDDDEKVSSSRQEQKREKTMQKRLLLLVVHFFCLGIYIIPLLQQFPHNNPVLDETHIVSPENKDVSGQAPWHEALLNDYWGRRMTSDSSHKSWRPLTIWTFRFLGGNNQLWVHRFFNVITHAATAELVSTLLLLPPTNNNDNNVLLTRVFIKLVFALHPTHVEVVANAANRPHLLACLFAVVLSHPSLHILGVFLFQIMGLTCAETFIFSVPAIILTLAYKQLSSQNKNDIKTILAKLLPRYTVIVVLTIVYIGGRFALDTLSIPDGLIRPAENPFYQFEGLYRIRNYLYVISIHVAKSCNLDFIGFSHEYGRNCIAPLESWRDARIFIPIAIMVLVVGIMLYVWTRKRHYTLLLLVHLAWMATLFPISGIIKVGTFVADRIVVASTVSTSILIGMALSRWFQQDNSSTTTRRIFKSLCITALLGYMWFRIHSRSLQWMDSLPLLQSSLKTCPRSAKSHLEMSKVHSGLYPNEFNLTKSLWHLKQVQEIDPDMCDVHQQFAHVYIQQQEYLKMEEHLVQGVLCPFSMAGSVELWRRYWQLAGQDKEAQERMQKYNRVIQAAVEEEQRKEALKARQQQAREQYGGYGGDL